MVSLDIPEWLIAFGVVAGLVWAIYNWTHRQHTP